MKKALLLLVFLSFMFTTFSQNLPDTIIARNYLQKSVRKDKTGNILLGIGTCLLVITAFTSGTFDSEEGNWTVDMSDFGRLGWAGFTVCAASIPFYISERRNKRKAEAAVSFGGQKIQLPQQGRWTASTQPALTMRVGL